MRAVFLAFLLLFSTFLNASEPSKEGASELGSELKSALNERVGELGVQLGAFETSLSTNVWMVKYANFGTYQRLKTQLNAAQNALQLSKMDEASAGELVRRIRGLEEQIGLLSGYEKSPFQEMLQVGQIEPLGKITNPFGLISAYSYIRRLEGERKMIEQRLFDLDAAIGIMDARQVVLSELADLEIVAPVLAASVLPANLKGQAGVLNNGQKEVAAALAVAKREANDFVVAKDVAQTTFAVYDNKLSEQLTAARSEVMAQFKQIGLIIAAIIATLLVGLVCKIIANRYAFERAYTINKLINIVNFTIIILILIFVYIENAGYVVTILGFASAGLAIAMKDMFMSLLGWSVIMLGGSFRVGDRIKINNQQHEFVGDIIDISLLRMTLYETITLTTYKQNRRGGRIIFIPNHYIFTDLIANYSHNTMKTVWDGIDVVLTFDSNHKKAAHIVKSIARKYSKGYTDIAKKQMTKMREQYSIKNPDVEPKVFTFLESYGLCVSVWYMTDSYATLVLRSTISMEMVEALNAEDDIKIAYPTQMLYMGKKTERINEHTL